MKLKNLKLSLLATGLVLGGVATAAYHAIPEVSSTTAAQVSALTGDVTRQHAESAVKVSHLTERELAMITDALRVLVKQTNLNHQQLAEADLDAKKLASKLEQGREATRAIVNSTLDHGAITGQGYNVCYILSESRAANKAVEEAKIRAMENTTKPDSAGGKLANNQAQVAKSRLDAHKEHFCTAGDVASGICEQEGTHPAADTNAAILNVSSTKGSPEDKAKTLFTQNLLGEPDKKVNKSEGTTSAGQAYLIQTNQRTARLSPAAYSMGYLHAMSTVDEKLKDADGKPMSPNEKIEATVNRYYGTKESVEWLKAVVAQRPRGLIVETAKMRGVEAYINYDMLQSDERQIAMLASAVATAYGKMDADMQRQYRSFGVAN